jgi:hypothetical protein
VVVATALALVLAGLAYYRATTRAPG